MRPQASARGFSLIEVMVAITVLTVGALGTAAIFSRGIAQLGNSPSDVIVTQKAAQAIEAVFSARDSHKLTWSQIRNVAGASGTDGGIFVDGPKPLYLPGADGLVNTTDDSSQVETVLLPGRDQMIGTTDDQTLVLAAFTREVKIRDVPNENGELRSITVTIIYQAGPTKKTYVLSSFISGYS